MTKAMVTLLVVALMPVISSAEGLDRENEISFRLGGYSSSSKIKIDKEDDVGKSGTAFGFRYIRNVNDRVGVGLEMNLLNAGEHESTTLMTNGISTTKLNTLATLGIVRVRFGRERFRPYALGGFGIHSTSLQLDSKPQVGFVWSNTGTSETRTLVDSRKTGVALALEGGFDYHFNDTVSAGAFLGWHLQSETTYDATAAGRAGGLTGIKGSFSGIALGGSFSARF